MLFEDTHSKSGGNRRSISWILDSDSTTSARVSGRLLVSFGLFKTGLVKNAFSALEDDPRAADNRGIRLAH